MSLSISRSSWHYKFSSNFPFLHTRNVKAFCPYMRRLLIQFAIVALLLGFGTLLGHDWLTNSWPDPKINGQFFHFMVDAITISILFDVGITVFLYYIVCPVFVWLFCNIRDFFADVKYEIRIRRPVKATKTNKRTRWEQILDRAAELYKQRLRDIPFERRYALWNECVREAKWEFTPRFQQLLITFFQSIHNKICPNLEFTD